nr:TerB family tellurite resistance protein [Desulfobacteraceae bacterium]
MGIMGKIIGGTIGFAIGGPLGAVAGAVFGHAFDASNDEFQFTEDRYLSSLESSQLAFFVSLFSMLAKLARVDGPINIEEIDAVEAFAVKDLHLAPPDREVALKIFHTALESPAAFEDFARQFPRPYLEQPQMADLLINSFFKVSVADGSLNTAEEQLIAIAVRFFALDDWRYRQIKTRYI